MSARTQQAWAAGEALSDGEAAEGLQIGGGRRQEGLQAHSRDPPAAPQSHLEQIPTCSPEDIIEALILDELHLFKCPEATLSLMNN